LPQESINLIFTDPDYSSGSGKGYRELSQYGSRVLKPGAVMIVEAPHKYLYSVMAIMEIYGNPQDLHWRWLYSLLYTQGSQRRLRMGIRVMFKPLLCYSKGKWVNRGFVKDGFECAPMKKKRHKWQKNLDAYEYYIKRHTDPNDIVLDPFVGSGTTAIACRNLGRQFVVGDCDFKCCAKLAEELK